MSPDDPTGYDFQADLHNGLAGPCEHGNDLFLPWHRAHLHYFEKLLQEADPPRTQNVTIPYWDWISEQTPEKFPLAYHKPGLTVPGRNDTDTALPPDTLLIVTTETDQRLFAGFPDGDPEGDYGRLEIGPHNYMHSFYIGGRMADPATAAEDPIYFSFHCFIDLMWAEWQRRNGTPPLTSPDHVLRGFTTQSRNKVADFTNTVDLGYEYEYNEKLKAAFDVPVPAVAPRHLLVTNPLHPLDNADLVAELQERELVQLAFAAPPEAGRRLVVRLDDLKVPFTGSYMLRANVHPADVPFPGDDKDFTSRYGVGYVVMWKAHSHMHAHPDGTPVAHHPTSSTVRFDVTGVLEASPTPVTDHVLTLQFVPAPSATGLPPQPVAPLDEVELSGVLMEVYS